MLSSGAPEKVLAISSKILLKGEEIPLDDALRSEINRAMEQMAQSGERLIGFGYHRLQADSKVNKQNLETEIVFVGILGFIDPPRKEVKGAIKTCQEAGIKIIMITGDHPETAKAIAAQVGIDNANVLSGSEISKMSDEELKKALMVTFVFARVTPEGKLRLVRLLKENGEIVAVKVTG